MGQFFKTPQLLVKVKGVMLEDSQHKGRLLLVMTADGLADVDKELLPSGNFRIEIGTGILCDVEIPIEVYKSPPFFHEWKTYDIENAILEKKEDEKCEVDAKITLELENYLLKCSNKKLVKQLRKDMTKIEELETNQRVGKFRVGTRAYRAKIRMTIQKYGQVENTANWSDSD
ncbi:hypothetical protein CRE_17053 [Caenorhabditis remanei]|uniref:Uncharacterized protein n=1 Tax=Caenorhabditis remanei TaxID=31234 RepID=E3M9W8_CAERE|nr:hypothetical protein CRE_17053 [Caenorhabditis remanei]